LAELGLSFGNVAPLYDRVRPSYLPEALDPAQEVLELDGSAEVLDLAAGTGRLTHELAQRFRRVIAVEPNDAMRRLIADGEVLAGTAEAIPLDDASVDAVFVGEAIHWFDAELAVPEIARVLRPRGGVARFENDWFEPEPPLPKPALELLDRAYVKSGRAGMVATWREAFAHSDFEPLRDEEFSWELPVDAEMLLALYQTISTLASLPAGEREALVEELRPLLEGPYVLPIRVALTWTRLSR
jgi:ubiquinone/menaquinone biosynthesis C-methylase UbiE